MYNYVPPASLEKLKLYKYSVVDASLLSKYVLQPYWNYMIRFMPWNIAPNLITLIGTMALVTNWLLFWYYVPLYDNIAPMWLYLFSAVAMEWYSLMDNLDGRQARRTKSSSPLGELFDHGCDCVAVALAACIAASAYQFGPYRSMITLVLTAGGFWWATWEEYHTGTMYLGFFNGPTEGIKLVSLGYLFIFIFGPQLYMQRLTDIFTFLPSFLSFEIRDFLVFGITGAQTIIPAIMSTQVVMNHPKNVTPERKMRAIGHMATYFIYWAIAIVWYNTATPLWHNHPHVLQMGVGIGFAEICSRLILAHLCHMEYSVLQRPMLPLFIMAAGSVLQTYNPVTPLISEEAMMWGFVLLNLFAFLHYTVCVINQLCTYLGIRALVIPKVDPTKSQ